MDCREMKQYLSLYMDKELGRDEAHQVENHLQECPACMEYYRSLDMTKQYCGCLGVMDLPSGFHERLYGNLVEEERRRMARKFRFRVGAGIAAAFLMVFISSSLLNCSSSKKADMSAVRDDADISYPMEATATSSAPESAKLEENGFAGRGELQAGQKNSSADIQSLVERKIIKSAYLSVETLDFDRFINTLTGRLSSSGGYIESSNVDGIPRNAQSSTSRRRAHFEIRVPKQYFQQFIADVGELGNLLTKQENGEDITGQYFDTEARLKSLEIQEERLLTILEKAEKLQDIIELERELSRTRYEIENLTGTLRKWDNMVDYSRISLDVYEVKELKEREPEQITWGQRVINAFKRSLEGLGNFSKEFVVFLAGALPYLVLWAAIGWILWKIVRWYKNSRKKE